MNDAAITVSCPVCRSPASPFFVKDGCSYMECTRCAFLFHRADSGTAVVSGAGFYGPAYWQSERDEAERREREDGFVRALELLCLSSVRVENILDFGCGLGITVRMLREMLGLNVVGVDITGDFVETEYLHRCDLAALSRKYPEGYFDAVYSIEVFEHLENPHAVLSLLHGLLKPCGKLLINTGTREFLKESDPDLHYVDPLGRGHISIYSLESFQILAAAIGRKASFVGERKFEVILAPETDGAPHPENLQRTCMLGQWFPQMLREYMRLIDIEREYWARTIWALQLKKEVDSLKIEMQRPASARALLKNVWEYIVRQRPGSRA